MGSTSYRDLSEGGTKASFTGLTPKPATGPHPITKILSPESGPCQEATNTGQHVRDDKSFTSGVSPYTGVWYCTDDAKIYADAVILGTIVAADDIVFYDDGSTITATPSNYPALMAMDSIKVDDDENNYDDTEIT